MINFKEDLYGIANVLIQGVNNSAINVVNTYIGTTMNIAAHDLAQKQAYQKVLEERSKDENFKKLETAIKFAEFLESTGEYVPDGPKTDEAVNQYIDDCVKMQLK